MEDDLAFQTGDFRVILRDVNLICETQSQIRKQLTDSGI